jgi:hypothetical protein
VFNIKKKDNMKKQYIIPATDVIEIKISPLLTTSLTVNTTDELDEGDILSRGGDFEEDF